MRAADLAPTLTFTTPTLDPVTVLAIGVPLYLVTMTSQNIPGVAVLALVRLPSAAALLPSGTPAAATVATAPLGGYSINLAAISAALAAGPTAGDDPDRRWVAGVSSGVTNLVLGPLAALVTTVAAVAPAGVIAAVAGLALVGTFAPRPAARWPTTATATLPRSRSWWRRPGSRSAGSGRRSGRWWRGRRTCS